MLKRGQVFPQGVAKQQAQKKNLFIFYSALFQVVRRVASIWIGLDKERQEMILLTIAKIFRSVKMTTG